MSIDWATALIGAGVGWVASSKVDEAENKFSKTIASGSAEGVKVAWKEAAKKAAKKAKKAAKKAAKTGKNV